jgi:hypothetical protein
MTLNKEQRADLVTARGTLRRAEEGYEDCDFGGAAAMIDRVLATSCPHGPSAWHTSPDEKSGRPLVACYACGVTWYAHFEGPRNRNNN